MRYIDWSEKNARPKILTMLDKNALISSENFFGRKFDMDIDATILNYLDEQVLKTI